MRSPLAHPSQVPFVVAGAAIALVAMVMAGCAAGTTTTPTPAPSPTAGLPTPAATIQQLIADVTAAGIDCSDAHHTGNDPGATDQMTCGGVSHTIEIETFASTTDVTSQFVPYLKDFFCHSSPDTVYLDGGTWAIYATKNADVQTIGASMNLVPTKLC